VSIERKPGKLPQFIVLSSLRAYLRWRFNIRVERNDTLDMKPPYLILSNHVNNWDPLFINVFVNEPVCFVAAAPLFFNKPLKRLLDYTGAIPKTKSRNDTSTIRNILKAKKHGRVIGIFPEGNRSWNGVTEPLVPSTAKLVKLLDIPVVIATIKGGYLTRPRWADSDRKGVISVSLVKKWDKGELAGDSIEDIHRKLTEALAYDEMAWQAEHPVPFAGKGLAHYLERVLLVCPACEQPGAMRSEEDRFGCVECGYTVRYTEYGFFEQVNGQASGYSAGQMGEQPLFRTVKEWDEWQLRRMARDLADPARRNMWLETMRDPVQVFVSEEEQPFRLLFKGEVTWAEDRLAVKGEGGQSMQFLLAQLDGLNIHFHHKLDFYYGDKFYRLVFYEPRSSAYKWLRMVQNALAQSAHSPEEMT